MKRILDSRKLLAFVTLAHCGSFTQTARELFITQSAVSHAIKSLEQDLECRLFDRLGRKARLTPAGRQLLDHAQRILEEMQLARAALAPKGACAKERGKIEEERGRAASSIFLLQS